MIDLEADFIFVLESWLETDILESPFDNFKAISCSAVRFNQFGRASGGLILFHKKSFNVSLISKTRHWLSVHVEIAGDTYVLVAVYLNEGYTEAIETVFSNLLESIEEGYPGCKLIIGGDWNSRIGRENNGEGDIFEGTHLYETRTSCDTVIDPEGRRLLSAMENHHNLFVLNGRTPGDIEGAYTCFAQNGMSTVDQVWINCETFEVIENFFVQTFDSGSDHLPCVVDIRKDARRCNMGSSPMLLPAKFNWNPNNSAAYQKDMAARLSANQFTFNEPQEGYKYLHNSILASSKELGMYQPTKERPSPSLGPPWYDKDCRSAKYHLRSAFRKLKRKRYAPSFYAVYLQKRKLYRNTLRIKNKSYYANLRNMLSGCKDGKAFWSSVKKLRGNNFRPQRLIMSDVEAFYDSLYSTVYQSSEEHYHGPFDLVLDSEVTLEEVTLALGECSNSKAPGVDRTPYEFFKNLPQPGIDFLVRLFNSVLSTGELPSSWCTIETLLIFKKGDDSLVGNYRGISLLNAITKIFSHIMLNRLLKFISTHDLLPETQNGFRKGRGTIDSIFTLTSVVQIATRLRGRRLFSAFIDFRRAFDSVSHTLLWSKLYRMGVSARFIRLVRSLYEEASFSVRLGDQKSKTYKISSGIIQGDTLSPVLFALFVADFDGFLRKKENIRGVSINSTMEIISLFYADDLVLFSDSCNGMNRTLRALRDYCSENSLEVNAGKSKIMVFQRSGRQKSYKFNCGNDPVEMVGSYSYLGVTFSRSGLFVQHAKTAVQKGTTAFKSVWPVIYKSQSSALSSWQALFSAAIVSTSAYASEIWGPAHTESIERVQVRAYKALLGLSRYTPDYLLRAELGLMHTKFLVANSMYRWWERITAMSSERLPRICFDRLSQLSSSASDARYNWALQLKSLLGEGSNPEAWTWTDPQAIKAYKSTFFGNLQNSLRMLDWEKTMATSYNSIPRNARYLEGAAAEYFSWDMTLFKKRLLAQLRLASEASASIYLHRIQNKFDRERVCPLCNMGAHDTIQHMISNCPIFSWERKQYLERNRVGQLQFADIMAYSSLSHCENLIRFLQTCLRQRAYIVSEGRVY